jgi:hypothetical protein
MEESLLHRAWLSNCIMTRSVNLPNLKNMVAEIPETGFDDNSATNGWILFV